MKRIFALAPLLLLVGCAAEATISVKTGFFFGHDLRKTESVVYVLDLSGSMREQSGSVVEQAGTGFAAKATGSLFRGFGAGAVGNAAEERIKKLQQKIEKVKAHLIACLNGLPQGSTFNVVLFSDGVQKLAPGLIEVNTASVALVSAFVSKLEARGSTSLGAALEAGLYAGSRNIVVLTDGLPTDSSPEAILARVRQINAGHAIAVSTVGVGG
ncbi:MAG: VWA domain-containing protein, partial [Deltaproteobacteria bacterium]|nr:VWA domain-containing protein [Deltaproteobacteria bacterium]